ncbi:Retrovirus-related Pol polyprotein from transposon, partial [Trichinella nelsoni]
LRYASPPLTPTRLTTGADHAGLACQSARIRNGKLPDLRLPQFSEEVLDFPPFWIQCAARFHDRSDLDVATKFAYFLSCTVGKAQGSIEGFPLTAASYTHAVLILNAHFGRPRCRCSALRVIGGRADETPALSLGVGQGSVCRSLSRDRGLDADSETEIPTCAAEGISFWSSNQRQAVSLPLPVEEGVKEAERRTECRMSPRNSPTPMARMVTALRRLRPRSQRPPSGAAHFAKYHTDAEVRSIMRAMDVQETDDSGGLKSALLEAFWVRTGPERFSAEFFRRKQQRGECVRVFVGHLRRLFPKTYPEMNESADKILLQQFKAGLSAEAVKTAVLRSDMVKTDAYQEDEPTAGRVTEAAAAAVTTRKEVGDDLAEVLRQLKELLTDNTPAATKRPLPRQRRRPERRGDRRCWKCGGLGHISRECQASSRDARASEVSITNRTLPVVVIRAPEIETPIVEGSVGGVRCDMLVDTGSAVTLADERFMRHSKTLRDVPKPSIRLETASGTELEITNACVTEIILGKSVTVQHTVLCVRELSHKILLGWDFMRYHGCTPDPTAGCLRMRQVESPQSELMAHHPAQEAMEKMLPSEQESSGKHRSALAAILREFADVLSTSDEDLGQTSVVRHAIYTGDAKPERCSPKRISYHQRAQVEAFLDEMLRRDVVEPSSSPWASPIVLVKKKDGSCRFYVDYRQLNNLTRKDAHPPPRIDDTLDALSGAQRFSTLDLASGYWQVEVEQQDREKTAFTIAFGLYQLKVMPFVLCNAPATFQRLMEPVLRGLVGSDCLLYLDDVIVFGKTAEKHTARLREVFRCLREVGLKVKPEKCRLMKRRVAYLGHIISEKGIATDPSKTSAVREWPTPTCVSELRQFLGLASYYRKFVNGFVNVAAPLHRLLEKGAEWDWSKACQSAFDALKREILGLVWALRKFRPYLYGQRFLLRTDHSCLRWLTTFKEPEGQIARWLESLAELDFEVEHRAGRLHGNADALSQTSCTQCGRLTSCWLPSRRTQRSNYCGNGWLARAGRWNVPRSVAATCTCCGSNGAAGWMKIASSGDIAADSRPRKGLSRRWCREPSETKSYSQCTTVGTQVTWAIAADYTLQRVGMDILGPLEKTPSENRYVLVLTDYFTRWTAACPIANMEASTVAKVLVERQWDDMPPFVMLAYNSSVHESTGVTPAIAMLGRQLRLPLDVQIGNPPGRGAQGLPDYITLLLLLLLATNITEEVAHSRSWSYKTQRRDGIEAGSTELPKSNPMYSDCPFVDMEGLLHVGGRLTNAALPWCQEHPFAAS